MMSEKKNLRSCTVSKLGIAKINDCLNALGFTIKTFDRFPKHAKVTMPDTFWEELSLEDDNHCVIDFYDENNIKRGNFYINKKTDIGSTIILNKRLNIHALKHGVMEEFYIGTENIKLISFGSVNTEVGSSIYIANQMSELQNRLKVAANEIYPDWKNPLAYWELTDEELLAMLPTNEEQLGETRVRTNPNFSSSNNID